MDALPHWIVTADNRHASLFACLQLPRGGIHMEQRSTIENHHESEHERHRPSLLSSPRAGSSIGRASSHGAPHSAAPGHEVNEEHARFAREVRDWLDHATHDFELKPGRITVFAGPHMLGELRRQVSGMDLREGDLANLDPAELSGHPAVLDALNAQT